VGGAFISETQQLIGRDIEISTDQLAMAEADVVCLGHIHKAQVMGRDKNIFYSGSIYRANFGEMDDKGFYIHDIRPAELDSFVVSSEFVLTPTRKLIKVREDATKMDINGALAAMHMAVTPDDLADAHIKVEFKVWQDEASQINQAALERSFLDAGAAWAQINLIRIPRETVRAARILTMDRLRDKIAEMAAVRMDSVSDEILAKADLLESTSPDELGAGSGEGELMKLLDLKVRGSIGIKKGMGLDEISLDLSGVSGLVALAGQNGRGKTTILECATPFRKLGVPWTAPCATISS
jgi:hypothetical protein